MSSLHGGTVVHWKDWPRSVALTALSVLCPNQRVWLYVRMNVVIVGHSVIIGWTWETLRLPRLSVSLEMLRVQSRCLLWVYLLENGSVKVLARMQKVQELSFPFYRLDTSIAATFVVDLSSKVYHIAHYSPFTKLLSSTLCLLVFFTGAENPSSQSLNIKAVWSIDFKQWLLSTNFSETCSQAI